MTNGKRLIDANALSKSIKEGSGTELQKFFADVCVATAPTVDAVEVVRCKDWKHFRMNSCWRVRDQYAHYGINNNAPIMNDFYPGDFCSYGERW